MIWKVFDIFQHDSDPNHSVNALEAYLGREINHIETRAINVNALMRHHNVTLKHNNEKVCAFVFVSIF